jgi:hypothetical protein
MLSFCICLILLIGGYFVYGKIVDNTFAPDDRETPAVKINDGVDYVVMPQAKLFLVQLLNIAGLGPIFGAMQGALWGPSFFGGSHSARSLPVASTTIFPVCSPSVTAAFLFPKSVVFIWAA